MRSESESKLSSFLAGIIVPSTWGCHGGFSRVAIPLADGRWSSPVVTYNSQRGIDVAPTLGYVDFDHPCIATGFRQSPTDRRSLLTASLQVDTSTRLVLCAYLVVYVSTSFALPS